MNQGTLQTRVISRSLEVYLPPSYPRSLRSYPVFYVLDGNRLFDPSANKVIEELEAGFAQSLLPELILVGIPTDKRNDDYTPWPSRLNEHLYGAFGGEGDAYIQEIISSIKPYIDEQFRTLSDRSHTGIAGASLGGLLAIYAYLRHPNIFGKVMGLSTSVWFEHFLPFIEEKTHDPLAKMYLDYGEKEGKGMVTGHRALQRILQNKGYSAGDLLVLNDPKGKHETKHFVKRFPDALKWLAGSNS
jgi:predicted alpha/beta superfamily hydrolase